MDQYGLGSEQMSLTSARKVHFSPDRPLPDVVALSPVGSPGARRDGTKKTERSSMAAKALSFDVGDYVVYPKHGVGRVVELQRQEIAGASLELYVLRFEKERMT